MFCASQLVAFIDKNNKSKCTICNSKTDSQNMENILLVCNQINCNSVEVCSVHHKVNHCLKSKLYKFNKLNQHDIEHEPIQQSDMSPKVKEFIKSLIFDYDISIFKKIEKKIIINIRREYVRTKMNGCLV